MSVVTMVATDAELWGDTPAGKTAREMAWRIMGGIPVSHGHAEAEPWGDTPQGKETRERAQRSMGESA
jgi:hypothetical protein